MKRYKKQDFPVSDIRRFLEPGPVVLVSSAYKGQTNIMTMGWHTVMEFTPSLVGCIIAGGNHSYDLVSRSRGMRHQRAEVHLARTVAGIGNCSGAELDKFKRFKLTAQLSGARQSAADRGMLRQSRMPPGRWPATRPIQFLHLRSGQGARAAHAEISEDDPLSR